MLIWDFSKDIIYRITNFLSILRTNLIMFQLLKLIPSFTKISKDNNYLLIISIEINLSFANSISNNYPKLIL